MCLPTCLDCGIMFDCPEYFEKLLDLFGDSPFKKGDSLEQISLYILFTSDSLFDIIISGGESLFK